MQYLRATVNNLSQELQSKNLELGRVGRDVDESKSERKKLEKDKKKLEKELTGIIETLRELKEDNTEHQLRLSEEYQS